MHFMFKNNRESFWDEVGLIIVAVISLAVGILLIVTHPSIWIFSENISFGIGIAFVMLSIMIIPCIIYRLIDNNKTGE